jgi:hypothetical protein
VSFPEPKPGLVVHCDYLWTDEAARGQDLGNDHPACLVAASDGAMRPRYVVLLPIRHTPPSGDTVGIDIPAKVKQAIGFDDAPSWVIVSEHNTDEWPNSGLSPAPGKAGVFGFIRPGLFARALNPTKRTKAPPQACHRRA